MMKKELTIVTALLFLVLIASPVLAENNTTANTTEMCLNMLYTCEEENDNLTAELTQLNSNYSELEDSLEDCEEDLGYFKPFEDKYANTKSQFDECDEELEKYEGNLSKVTGMYSSCSADLRKYKSDYTEAKTELEHSYSLGWLIGAFVIGLAVRHVFQDKIDEKFGIQKEKHTSDFRQDRIRD